MPDNETAVQRRKNELRRLMQERRADCPPALLEELSHQIAVRLSGLELWQSCRFPCIYISAKPGEVDTHALIRQALAQGKRVCVPVTYPGVPDLEIVEITSLDPLVSGHYGLLDPDPRNRHALGAPQWDLVVAPGLVFDRRGNRIGFGRGYYDRLLRRATVPAAALAFSFQIVADFEPSPQDVRMDYIVTEHEVIKL